ncbi:MAG: FliH/SctL family protein [Proteobacteria bacterium]|nr:FliH/SctL family protein [Pseudomonadota bacterium]
MASNSDTAVPKEKLSAYQRWELDSFDGPRRINGSVQLPSVEQIEGIQRQAQQEGFAAGFREGGALAAQQAAQLQKVLNAFSQESQQFNQNLSEELLSLALAISKQVIRESLKVHPELILAIVNEVLGQLPHAHKHARLSLHPEDAALVRTRLGDAINHSGWHIIEDAKIARGGCRLDTPDCEVDASLEGRWQRVVSALGEDHAWIE